MLMTFLHEIKYFNYLIPKSAGAEQNLRIFIQEILLVPYCCLLPLSPHSSSNMELPIEDCNIYLK